MNKTIKSSMLFVIFLLLNACMAFNLESFGDNFSLNQQWKVFGNVRINSPSSVEFPKNDVSTKIIGAIYNSYDLSNVEGLEISLKPTLEKTLH